MSEDQEACAVCLDMGIARIKSVSQEGEIDELIRCFCPAGGRETVKIPQWDDALKSLFLIEKCPPEWFIPKLNELNNDKFIYKQIQDLMVRWLARLKKAEKFFQDGEIS